MNQDRKEQLKRKAELQEAALAINGDHPQAKYYATMRLEDRRRAQVGAEREGYNEKMLSTRCNR